MVIPYYFQGIEHAHFVKHDALSTFGHWLEFQPCTGRWPSQTFQINYSGKANITSWLNAMHQYHEYEINTPCWRRLTLYSSTIHQPARWSLISTMTMSCPWVRARDIRWTWQVEILWHTSATGWKFKTIMIIGGHPHSSSSSMTPSDSTPVCNSS